VPALKNILLFNFLPEEISNMENFSLDEYDITQN
jgi:hypothetical protein